MEGERRGDEMKEAVVWKEGKYSGEEERNTAKVEKDGRWMQVEKKEEYVAIFWKEKDV